jgi:hypothetical protein
MAFFSEVRVHAFSLVEKKRILERVINPPFNRISQAQSMAWGNPLQFAIHV